MSDMDYNTMRMRQSEGICRSHFGLALQIEKLFGDDIETGDDSYCILFQTVHKEAYALYISRQPQTLARVRHIAKSMGFAIESYAAPYGDASYFRRKGFEIFKGAYPGKKEWTTQEAAYYQTLVSYSPALVKISNVPSEIRRYNANYSSKWQKAVNLRSEKAKVQA